MRKNKSIMKGLLSSIFVFIFALAFTATSTFAASLTIKGKIKDSSNANASGASVSITCNATTIGTTSDANGNFEVVFPDGVCNAGDMVTVNALLNGESGSAAQSAQPNTTNFGNIQLSVVAVPEFGVITGLVAAAGSGLVYLKMRKGMA